jgi:hypothetical protein
LRGTGFAEGFGGRDDRAGSGDFIIEDDDVLAFDLADDETMLDLFVIDATLVDDGHRNVQPLGELAGALAAAGIGGHRDRIGEIDGFADMGGQDGNGRQMIDRIEKNPWT